MFNELRSDLVLLYELKQAHSNCEYEQQMLRHRYEALLKAGSGGGSGCIASSGLAVTTQSGELNANNISTVSMPGGESHPWSGVDDIKVEAKEQIIDVVGAPLTPNSVSLCSLHSNSFKPSAGKICMYDTKDPTVYSLKKTVAVGLFKSRTFMDGVNATLLYLWLPVVIQLPAQPKTFTFACDKPVGDSMCIG